MQDTKINYINLYIFCIDINYTFINKISNIFIVDINKQL